MRINLFRNDEDQAGRAGKGKVCLYGVNPYFLLAPIAADLSDLCTHKGSQLSYTSHNSRCQHSFR